MVRCASRKNLPPHRAKAAIRACSPHYILVQGYISIYIYIYMYICAYTQNAATFRRLCA